MDVTSTDVIFQIVKEINKLIIDAVRRLRIAMRRRGQAGRKKMPGRFVMLRFDDIRSHWVAPEAK